MRIDRLFGILVYLLDSGHACAAELARHFGTSERTIYRDMEALSLAGIPLVAIPGAGGGYQLAERYSLDKGFLSQVELSALRAVLSPIAHVSGGGSLALALGKLAAFGSRDGDELAPTIAASPFPWGRETTEPVHFGHLRQAVEEHRLVRIAYSGTRIREESRVIEVVIRLPHESRILILDRFPHSQAKELVSGGYEVVFHWPAGEELLRYLMSFGSGLEVVSPPELRSSLRTALESLARLNG